MSTPTAALESTPLPALPELRLKPREERRLTAGHLWIFSNEVDTGRTPLTAFEPGGLCRVVTSHDRFLGFAYVNPHALICARIVGRDPGYPPGKPLIVHRLQVALALRERLYERPYYRLAHGESDGLPGLVLDRYGDVVVGQVGTAGMEALKGEVVAAVQKVVAPRTFIWKNDSGARELEGLASYVETASGPDVTEGVVEENGVGFVVPLGHGQKTGWFYDQAANRRALLKYVPGRRVLDVFCYLGGWGLAAARAGAAEVLCVDSSAPALELLQRTVEANALHDVRTERGDAFDTLAALRAAGEKFDVVVIDPPAFIKRRKDVPKGQAAYRKLNQLAMQVLSRDGILVSCSCSHHLAQEDLLLAIQQSARHLDRFAQVLEVGGQAPDHPIHPAIPETRYLKSLFCRVVHD
jgi:23S rRNA (cytosine1962-C5)-methyltransferase